MTNKHNAETANANLKNCISSTLTLLVLLLGSIHSTRAQQVRALPKVQLNRTRVVDPNFDGDALEVPMSLSDIAKGIPNSGSPVGPRMSVDASSLKNLDAQRGNQLRPESLQNTIPFWEGSFSYQGLDYKYKMVGTDPQTTNQTTVIPTVIVPLRFLFPDGQVFDASTEMDRGETAIQRIIESPIFQNYDFVLNGTHVGNTQFGDAFQRANFWDSVSTRAKNYHVLLGQPTVLPSVTVVVPAEMASYYTEPISGKVIPLVDELFLRDQTKAAAPSLGISPRSLPIVLWGKVFASFPDRPGVPGIIAFHGAFSNGGNAQTCIGTSYLVDEGAINVNDPDVFALSHEVVEWLDNPFVDRYAPGWNFPFIQPHEVCDSQFTLDQWEVADPVEFFIQSRIALPGGPFTYHVTEAVFIDYFTRMRSRSVNGQYSMFTIGAPFGLRSEPSSPCAGHVEVEKTLFDIPGAVMSAVTGINNIGGAVGDYVIGNRYRGFLLTSSGLSALDFPGASETLPQYLNDKGDVVGYFIDNLGLPHGFLYSQGHWTQIDFPGSSDTILFGINAQGDMVGAFDATQPITHGFTFINGKFTQIDTPYGIQSAPTGINDLGVITGNAWDDLNDDPVAFTLTKGNFRTFNFPGAFKTLLSAINNQNDLVGLFYDAEGPWGFVTVNGYPHRVWSSAIGINDLQQICGATFDVQSGTYKGFIGTLPLHK